MTQLCFMAHMMACVWFYTWLAQERYPDFDIDECEGGKINCTPNEPLLGWWQDDTEAMRGEHMKYYT
jgi:hypothetical protein